jgi:hypothetical protein
MSAAAPIENARCRYASPTSANEVKRPVIKQKMPWVRCPVKKPIKIDGKKL